MSHQNSRAEAQSTCAIKCCKQCTSHCITDNNHFKHVLLLRTKWFLVWTQGCHSGVMVSTLAREARGLWLDSQLWQLFFHTPFISLIALDPSLEPIRTCRQTKAQMTWQSDEHSHQHQKLMRPTISAIQYSISQQNESLQAMLARVWKY